MSIERGLMENINSLSRRRGFILLASEIYGGGSERYIPHVLGTSAGVDQSLLAFLCKAYQEDEIPDLEGVPQARHVLKFRPRLAHLFGSQSTHRPWKTRRSHCAIGIQPARSGWQCMS